MSKHIIIIGIALIIGIYLYKKHRRIEKIDFLNLNASANGKWTQLTPEELDHVYKTIALSKKGFNPSDQEQLELIQILKKYNISL